MYVDSLQFKRAAVPVLCYPRCGGDRMKHVTAVGASLRRSIQSREDFGRLEHAPPLALVNQADNTFGKQVVEGGVGCRRSEEHTSELQSLMRISYAVFCLKKKITKNPT